MNAAIPISIDAQRENNFPAGDIEQILREYGWLNDKVSDRAAVETWCARAAFMLGPQSADREALTELLALIFHYDASTILQSVASHAVLSREGAKDVIRELALNVLASPSVDSERFKIIITTIKSRLPYSGRELFYPIRLALAGRTGGGELDRVILLLDDAAATPGLTLVKNARQRMLEFCAAME